MNLTQVKKNVTDALAPHVGANEATAMMRVILHHFLGYEPVDIVLNGARELEPETITQINAAVQRVTNGEPLQYVLGTASFMGLNLKVTPDVLIPRPETAQLVDMIADESAGKPDLRVLDACTGSGCIALALSRALVFPTVTAYDISAGAVGVARENAQRLRAKINIVQADALADSLPDDCNGPFDIIVSNPPYIACGERHTMDARVYEHEPSQALFVPDADPLMFYRAIARKANEALAPEGTLYFEINPLYATQLQQMMKDLGWSSCNIVRDFRGNKRFAICRH